MNCAERRRAILTGLLFPLKYNLLNTNLNCTGLLPRKDVSTLKDASAIQKDHDRLESWAGVNRVQFNLVKREVLHLGESKSKPQNTERGTAG